MLCPHPGCNPHHQNDMTCLYSFTRGFPTKPWFSTGILEHPRIYTFTSTWGGPTPNFNQTQPAGCLSELDIFLKKNKCKRIKNRNKKHPFPSPKKNIGTKSKQKQRIRLICEVKFHLFHSCHLLGDLDDFRQFFFPCLFFLGTSWHTNKGFDLGIWDHVKRSSQVVGRAIHSKQKKTWLQLTSLKLTAKKKSPWKMDRTGRWWLIRLPFGGHPRPIFRVNPTHG